MPRTGQWATVLDAARRSGATGNGPALLDHAVALGSDVAPEVVGCSVTVGLPHGWSTPHAWRAVALTLDRAQYDAGTGPCVHAATTGNTEQLDVIAEDGRFPAFAAAAAAHGVLSSLSVPLPQAPQPSALNIYAVRRGAFDLVRNREIAGFLARVVARLLGAPERGAPGVGSEDELARRRGESVRQAAGVRAAQTGTTPDEAYLGLALRTRREGRPMVELAAAILDDDAAPSATAGL